ncbi:MAG: hypothetical protein ACYC0V_01225 [Armatimonadota bacterium]
MAPEISSARLYFILARNARVGVIFRRGPSKWVQIIKWDMKTDEFLPGQWFNGRIYEKRADLSPDGTKMIYFAQKITARSLADTEYTYAWTAISKPPYLTAIVLWPKGDCWHGGGLFIDNNKVWLNHQPEVAHPHRDHMPPKNLAIIANPQAYGEDDPVHMRRLARDRWILEQEWEGEDVSYGYRTIKPEIMSKHHPSRSLKLVMEFSITRYDGRYTFFVENGDGLKAKVPNAEWADWDRRGRLCYVGKGKVFAASVNDDGEIQSKELADFNDRVHEEKTSPEWARRW